MSADELRILLQYIRDILSALRPGVDVPDLQGLLLDQIDRKVPDLSKYPALPGQILYSGKPIPAPPA